MLKGKRGVSACSLSSCRIKAEALARALNSRIWPYTWVDRGSSGEMSNGVRADEDEEFFDASPSPIEDGEQSFYRHDNRSAVTAAGKARLYELLQQHATDDSVDVFYDVSDDEGVAEQVGELDDNLKELCLKSQDPIQDENSCQLNNAQSSELNGVLNCESNAVEKECDSEILEISMNDDNLEITISNGRKETVRESPSKVVNPDTAAQLVSESRYVSNLNSLPNNESDRDDSTAVNSENVFENSVHNLLETGACSTNDETFPDAKANLKTNGEHGLLNDGHVLELDNNLTEESMPETVENNEEVEEETNPVAIEITVDPDSSPLSAEVESSEDNGNKATCEEPSVSSRLQVFDEARPKISRSTSLKTGKTPPGTPSRKKIVRFADVLGLDLEDVRHIMTTDVPIIPSSAYTDLDLTDADLQLSATSTEIVEVENLASRGWESLQGVTGPNILYPMFAIPGHQSDFMDSVRKQGICLETVVVSDMSVQCTCRVMNWGFRKKVIARYTVNDWASSNDIDASYVPGSTIGDTDNFSFRIFLSPLHKNVKFALKYNVNGKDYWDNNKGENYCLGFHCDDNMPQNSSPTWQHQFW